MSLNIISSLKSFVSSSPLKQNACSYIGSAVSRICRIFYDVKLLAVKATYTKMDIGIDSNLYLPNENDFNKHKAQISRDIFQGCFTVKITSEGESKVEVNEFKRKETKEDTFAALHDHIKGLNKNNELKQMILYNSQQSIFVNSHKIIREKQEEIIENESLGYVIYNKDDLSIFDEKLKKQSGSEVCHELTSDAIFTSFKTICNLRYQKNDPSDLRGTSDAYFSLRLKVKYVVNLENQQAVLYYKPVQSFYLTKFVFKTIPAYIASFTGSKKAA